VPENRVHDVSTMTDSELDRARRHLLVSLSLAITCGVPELGRLS
jgi:hypothetical protein